MLKVLNNPCTDNYYKFRDIVLGDEFNWVWYEKDVISPPGHIHMPFYGHSFLNRPEQNKFTEVKSNEEVIEAYLGRGLKVKKA